MKRYQSSQGTYLRRAKNRKAFYAVLESYTIIRMNSVVKAMDTSDVSGGTPNPATPSTIDFVCDVDNVIKKQVDDGRFYQVFVDGTDEYSKEQKFKYEQLVGRMFVVRQLWPVKKYFTVQRRRGV